MKERKLVRHNKKSWRKLQKDANELYADALQKQSLSDNSILVAPEFVLDRSNRAELSITKKASTSPAAADKWQQRRGALDSDRRLLARLGKQAPRRVNIARRFPRDSDPHRPADTPKDVWEVAPESEDEHGIRENHLRATKQRRVKVHKRYGAKVARVAAVVPPAPGASYNPTAASHQLLLEQEAAVQARLDREERHLQRQLDSCFPARRPTEADHLREMEAGLFEEEEEEEEEADSPAECEAGVTAAAAAVKVQKKTRAQRNRQQALKQLRSKRLRRDAAQRLDKELKNVDAVSKRVRQEEKRLSAKRELRAARKAAELQERPYRRLGPHRLPPAERAVQLPQELAASLRQLTPKTDSGGSPAEALLESMQRRGLLEPRQRVKTHRPRYQPKHFAKSSARLEEAPRRVATRTAPLL